jgi:hypothetical protein
MPICNLATSYVAPSTLGEPPLDTSGIAITARLDDTGNLNAVFTLSFSTEYNLYSCEVKNTSLTVLFKNITVSNTSSAHITKSTAFAYYNLFVVHDLKSSVHAAQSQIRGVTSANFKLATTGLVGTSDSFSSVSSATLASDILEGSANSVSSAFLAVFNDSFFVIHSLNPVQDVNASSSSQATDLISAYPLPTQTITSISDAVSANLTRSFIGTATSILATNSPALNPLDIFTNSQVVTCSSDVIKPGNNVFLSTAYFSTAIVDAISTAAVGVNLFYTLSRDIPLVGDLISTASAVNLSTLNRLLKTEKSIAALSSTQSIPTELVQVGSQRPLSAAEVSILSITTNFLSGKYSLAVIAGVSSQNSTCLSNTVSAKLSTGVPLQNILSVSNTAVSSAKFGAQAKLSTLAIACTLSQPDGARPSLPGRTVTISSTPEITPTLSGIAGIYAQFAIAYQNTKPANSTPSLSLIGSLSANSRIGTTPSITAVSLTPVGIAAPTMLVIGAVDYPDQIQEYVRYPLPTATSAASALDEDGSPVQYSHSVFGSTILRLTPGLASSAGVSLSLRASQLGSASQYAVTPNYDAKLILLRTSVLDTTSLQRTVFGNIAVGPDVTRVAAYSSFPRSYGASVGSMGAGGSSTLVSAATEVTGTYSAPTVPVLFMGSALVRHNYNQAASILKPSAVATDYYYPEGSGRKIAKARVETTAGTYTEGLSPIYSSSAFRLLSPTEYLNYSAGGANFRINAAVMAQDGTTSSAAHVHASDAMMTFLPIKSGARYAYSRYRPSALASTATIVAAGFEGGAGASSFSVSLATNGAPVAPETLYSADADCVLRILISPYTASGFQSFVYVDIPVLGVSTVNPDRVIVDISYRWFIEECLTGGAFASTHMVRSLKDFYSTPNAAPSLTTKAVLAVTRPVVSITGDQGESAQQKLSFSGDRNLLMGEFSVAISRPTVAFDTALKVNVEPQASTALEVYNSAATPASKVSSFDPNSLHLFVKSDGTLGCRRSLQSYAGPEVVTSLDPILPKKVREFIAAGGLFSQVKVGESIIALLSSGNTGKKLFLWGYNTYGHLDVPAAVDANFLTNGYILNVKDFDFNAGHIAVILDNGQLYSWGNSLSSVWKSAGSPISNMAIGENFSVAIVERFDSANPNTPISVIEQYGDCPSSASVPAGVTAATPTPVWTAPQAGQIVYAGKVLACGKNHAVLLKNDGTVVCWGNNTYGQSTVPVGLSGVIAVDAGDNHTIALKNDNTVVCWGDNTYGQTSVPAGLRAKSISAGGDFCVAIRTAAATDVNAVVGSVANDEIEDTAACWGRNNRGQRNVPTCEGVSYDPTFHNYRMRFWAAYCGWDHTIGVRRDDVQSKWATQHPELNRLNFSTLIKLPLKSSGGTTIFACLRRLGVEQPTPGVYKIVSSTGVEYPLTLDPNNAIQQISAEVTVSSRKYRLVFNTSYATTYIQWTNVSPVSWQLLTFGSDVYDSVQDLYNSTFTEIGRTSNTVIDLGWDGIPATPTWRATVGSGANVIGYSTLADNNEYIDANYATAESFDPNLNQSLIAWGNPMAWSASLDSTQYSPYYPGTESLKISVGSDISQTSTKTSSASRLNYIFSYVGYGKQLGIDLIEGGLGGSSMITRAATSDALKPAIYVGPRSLEVIDNPNNSLVITTYDTVQNQYDYALGSSTIFVSAGGSLKYFNVPTPVSATAVNLYARPEELPLSGYPDQDDLDSALTGFNNKSIYMERFGVALPSGYSIVANGSGSLPIGTQNSATGYHLLFSGTVGGTSRTLVMTGAYALYSDSASAYSISLPRDPSYSGTGGLDVSWLADLGITIKKTRVVKHQLNYKFDGYIPYAGKHLTVFKQLAGVTNYSARGLTITSSSSQVVGGISQLRSLFGLSNLQVFIGGRSAVLVNKHGSLISSRAPVYTEIYGDNTKGQLNIRLFGPFAVSASDLNTYSGAYSVNWLMDYDQTVIGHTEDPALTYGFKKVACGQFHTLAIDENGYVHARGLNNAINAPIVTVAPWDPITYSTTGCRPDVLTTPAVLTGYFSNLSAEDIPACSPPISAFDCNRAPCQWPAGATNKNLTDSFFAYPDVPMPWSYYDGGGCPGSYTTNGALLFDKAGFVGPNIQLIKQRVLGGFGFTVGLEQSGPDARLYLTPSDGGARTYSQPFAANPHLIYVAFPYPSGLNASTYIKAKIDGEYIKWAADSYLSPAVDCVSYRRVLDVFGDTTTISPNYSITTLRENKPITSITKMVAGDNFFSAVYESETDPRSRIRGSIIGTPGGDDPAGAYPFFVGDTRSDVQGRMFPCLDFSGPKDYFISIVSRTYNQISGSVPAGAVYSGATAATIRYDSANPNFRIYIGGDSSAPLDYSNENGGINGRWPKVVFSDDPEWTSSKNPSEIYGYRQLGEAYATDEFKFIFGNPTLSNTGVYPAYPVVNINNELSLYVTYDVASRRLLPQSYEPATIPTSPSSISLGNQCAFAITSTNTVFSWGLNHNKQRSGVDAQSLNSVSRIASSYNGSVVLTVGGAVKVLGFPDSTPMLPPDSLGTSSYVAATSNVLAAIDQTTGLVTCWGIDLGYNLITPPQDLGSCTQISGGQNHFAALRTDGKVVCWGDNNSGQCTVPAGALSNVVKVVCGALHTVALKNTGQVLCWGNNTANQCTIPGTLGTGCLDVAAGDYHTVAIKSNNTIAAWGSDAYGVVTNVPAGSYIKLGTGFSSEYAVAVRTVGTGGAMVAWGRTGATYYTAIPTVSSRRTLSFNPASYSTVGPYKHVVISAPTSAEVNAAYAAMPASIRAKNPDRYYSSTELSGLEHAIAVAAGSNAYYAVKASTYAATQGSLVAWGSAGSDSALTVPTGSTFVSVHSRNRHAAARRADNTVACWGNNSNGQAVSPAGTYSMVACGDTFNVAIDASTDKLAVWGSISSVPAPYSNIRFTTVSAGKAHIVGRALAYSEFVAGGTFSVGAGAVLAFGDNAKGQCNIPGFSYSSLNRSFVCPAVAGGEFTAYELATSGFDLTSYRGGTGASDQRVVALMDDASEDPESTYTQESERLEGHIIHKSGLLCPAVLPLDHPYAINPPTTSRLPGGGTVGRQPQRTLGFTPRNSLITNATNVPTAFRRGGSRKAKLIAAGRYYYHTQNSTRYPYGAGYSVIVAEDGEVVVFGGDLLPANCIVSTYTPPSEALAIRDISAAGITFEDVIAQIGTYRGIIYALKSTGDIAQWGYDDVSTTSNPEFYKINPAQKQYFSLPDNSLQDILPRLTQYDNSNIAMSYVSGIPGVTDSWSVDVSLDRYFDGQKTNIKKFSAVGQSSLYSISDPVHFAETFLAVDTWPGDAQFLDSQYVLSIIPRGVACTVNSASMFALNLDSKVGLQRVFVDGANMGSNMTQPADFLIASKQGTDFTSSALTVYDPVKVTTASENSGAITLGSSSSFTSPSFIRNSYGGSAKLEFVGPGGTSARTGGRVAYPAAIDPSDIAETRAWFKYESLPPTAGTPFVTSWTSSITTETISLAEGNSAFQPNVVAFNTSFRGAQFDRTSIDRLTAPAAVSESSFTYFLVYTKPANTQATHCAFGKYALPSAGNPRVQGIGFSTGRPVLFTGQVNDIATSAVTTNTPGIICGYFGGALDKGIRLNGTEITSYASTGNSTFMPTTGITTGYHLGGPIAGVSSANSHDTNDVYAEVVAVEGRLSNSDIEVIEGYLAHKFNLQGSLPGGHPYKVAPAVYDSVNSVYPIDFLQDPFMLLESNRLTGSSGQSQTWLGMFEVNVKHNTKRTSNSGTVIQDHHAPLLAEFGFTVGITANAIAMPIAAVSNAVAALTVDSTTNYLLGTATCKLNTVSANIAKQRVLPATSVICSAFVSTMTMTPRVGLVGFAFGTLGIFGSEDCDPVYGCLGVSDLPPELTVLSQGTVPAPINAVLATAASITRIVTFRFGLIECELDAVATMSRYLALQGSCSAVSTVNPITVRTINTYLGVSNILGISKTQVCVPDFFIKPPSAPKIGKPTAPQPFPDLPGRPIDLTAGSINPGDSISVGGGR